MQLNNGYNTKDSYRRSELGKSCSILPVYRRFMQVFFQLRKINVLRHALQHKLRQKAQQVLILVRIRI